MRQRLAYLGMVIAALAGTRSAEGQTPAAGPAPVPSACTYASCALRVEKGFLSNRLVRGAAGERVSRLGSFGGGIDLLLTGPDSAAAHARSYVRNSRIGGTLGLLGTIAYVVVLVRTDGHRDRDLDDGTEAAAIASFAFGLASVPFNWRAQRSLSRGVWWYNEALPR